MTTLERAARALAAEDGKRFSGRSLYDHNSEIYINLARAVLMAVLPEEADADGAPDWMDPAQAYGWGCGFNACRDAILAEGE